MNEPRSLDDFVISRHDEQMPLLKAYVEGSIEFPSSATNTIILHGKYGSGKTRLSRLLPEFIESSRATEDSMINGKVEYETELISCGGQSLAEKQKKISFIRERMRSGFWPMSGWYRYFIFDEVDEWLSSQSDLKSLMSNTDARSVFILTTNHIDKLDKGLISRAICFEMDKVEPHRYLPILRRYYPFSASISDVTLIEIVKEADSDWRELKRMISELQWKHLNRFNIPNHAPVLP